MLTQCSEGKHKKSIRIPVQVKKVDFSTTNQLPFEFQDSSICSSAGPVWQIGHWVTLNKRYFPWKINQHAMSVAIFNIITNWKGLYVCHACWAVRLLKQSGEAELSFTLLKYKWNYCVHIIILSTYHHIRITTRRNWLHINILIICDSYYCGYIKWSFLRAGMAIILASKWEIVHKTWDI